MRVTFREPGMLGGDAHDVAFANGGLVMGVALGPGGKIAGASIQPGEHSRIHFPARRNPA